jgi:hypothetical protein
MSSRRVTAGGRARGAVLLVCLGLAWLTGCRDTFHPDRLDATGHWTLGFPLGPTDFTFDLHENPDGTIAGTWSFPSLFAHHPVKGRREGIEVNLTADSPNPYPVVITATFVGLNRMEGHYYFGGEFDEIVLWRRRTADR